MAESPELYVVDTPVVAQGLTSLLRQHFPHVHPLHPTDRRLPTLSSRPFLLVEIRLPDGLCGLRWARGLRQQHPHLHVALWTHDPAPFSLWLAYRWGFTAFLDKAMPPSDFLHHLRLLLEGRATWLPDLFRQAIHWGQTIAPLLTPLPPSFWHLWEGLLQGEDVEALSRRLGVSVGTVRRKRRELFEELGVRGWAEAVRRACEWGLTEVRDGQLGFRPVVWEMLRETGGGS